jgi:tricorn protease
VLGLDPADATATLRLAAAPVAGDATKITITAVIDTTKFPTIGNVEVGYRLAARNAPAWSVFARMMEMVYGEIDGSHFGFWASDTTRARWFPRTGVDSWKPITAHLGARFDPDWKGEGWRVRDVVPDSPADRGSEGLLAGDVVLSIDGKAVAPGMDYAEAMNTPLPHRFALLVQRAGETNAIVREIEAVDFQKIRRLLRAAEVKEARRRVREKGNFGYLAIDAMLSDTADAFTDAVFAECFGKDGVVIDVRYNTGGYTADRLIDILCGSRHVRTLYRGVDEEGYIISRFGRPVITSLPVVVLANERSQSNAEEFTHAMKSLGRAKVVGTETAGDVIGTFDLNLLDYGVMRRPRIGFFLPDGTDLECHGAKPDIEVERTPADIAAGRDPQLEAAVGALAEEVSARRKPPPPRFNLL